MSREDLRPNPESLMPEPPIWTNALLRSDSITWRYDLQERENFYDSYAVQVSSGEHTSYGILRIAAIDDIKKKKPRKRYFYGKENQLSVPPGSRVGSQKLVVWTKQHDWKRPEDDNPQTELGEYIAANYDLLFRPLNERNMHKWIKERVNSKYLVFSREMSTNPYNHIDGEKRYYPELVVELPKKDHISVKRSKQKDAVRRVARSFEKGLGVSIQPFPLLELYEQIRIATGPKELPIRLHR